MKRFAKIKLVDKLVVGVLPLFTTAVCEAFNLNFLYSTLLFFGLPSLYLSFRAPQLIRKSFIFTLPVFLVIYFVFDYLAWAADAWYVPGSLLRFLGGAIPIEDGIWGLLWPYYILMTWEFFLEDEKKRDWFSGRFSYFLLLCAAILMGFFALYFFKPQLLVLRYFYIKLALVFGVIPLILTLRFYPKLLPKLIAVTIYFFLVSGLAEFIGLRHHQWYFGSDYFLPLVNFFGFSLPLDEPFAWWFLGAPALVCWYEFFADDCQNQLKGTVFRPFRADEA